ncbi:MAG: response regulator [Planctomycetes bacterium]|nr:response regulator [Planctomycetota bacterium]
MSQVGEVGKILIVDDNQANVRLLDINLRAAGYATEMAYDGEEALDKVAATKPDLILLDVMMPKLDGYEVCRRLRADEATSVIPVIMITALKDSEDRIRGLECGADDFVSKPFDKTELLARVKNLLRVKYYRSMIAERQKFDAVIEDLSHGIIIADGTLTTTVVSRQAQVLLGRTDQDCVGRNVFELFDGFAMSPDARELRATTERTVTVDLEQMNVSPGVYLSGRWTKITDPAGALTNLAFVFRDVTRERRKEKLQRDFLSLVSHKLKTPLTIVSGYLSLISAGKYGDLNSDLSQAFHLVESRVADLKVLIEKLLQYAGLSAEELRHEAVVVDLQEVIERSVARMVGRYGADHAEIHVELPEGLPQIRVDVEHMALVLDNLFDNAVKFSQGEAARIEVTARAAQGDMIEITVRDFGPGIPPQHQDDIFSDFLQVEDWFTGNVGGLGLGLPTAKRLVENWGGEIGVDSKVGQGSAFHFTVPTQPAEPPSPAAGPGTGPGLMETA